MITYTSQQLVDILFTATESTIRQEDIDRLAIICNEMGVTLTVPSMIPRPPPPQPSTVNTIKWGQSRKSSVSKQSFDHKLNMLKMNINKLTDKNYNTMSKEIIAIANDVCEHGIDREINYFSSTIFDIASTNRFYSDVFAALLCELSVHDKIRETIHDNVERFLLLFQTIETGNPEENYELFCSINKTNEKRKAISAFYTNLAKRDMISNEKIVECIQLLVDQIKLLIGQSTEQHKVHELIENIVILVDYYPHEETMEYLREIVRTKSYPGLSKKSLFKLMDHC